MRRVSSRRACAWRGKCFKSVVRAMEKGILSRKRRGSDGGGRIGGWRGGRRWHRSGKHFSESKLINLDRSIEDRMQSNNCNAKEPERPRDTLSRARKGGQSARNKQKEAKCQFPAGQCGNITLSWAVAFFKSTRRGTRHSRHGTWQSEGEKERKKNAERNLFIKKLKVKKRGVKITQI